MTFLMGTWWKSVREYFNRWLERFGLTSKQLPLPEKKYWKIRKTFTVSKERSDSVKGNEDVCFTDTSSGTFAVSDGASASFDAKAWADVLLQCYGKAPHKFTTEHVVSIALEFDKKYDYDGMTGPQQIAYEKGSHATLMGVVTSDSHLNVTYVGDSLLVVLNDLKIILTIPFESDNEFPLAPELLTCCIGASQPEIVRREVDVQEMGAPSAILMTDALGQWFLKIKSSGLNPVEQLLAISSQEDFEAFVERSRTDGVLKRDDTTLLWIERDSN